MYNKYSFYANAICFLFLIIGFAVTYYRNNCLYNCVFLKVDKIKKNNFTQYVDFKNSGVKHKTSCCHY